MNFDRESWRKLYVRESAEDRLLPLLCRSLRDHLIRHAKDDGTLLASTDDPVCDMARALSAHRAEVKAVEGYLQRMLDSAFLSYEERRLWITNFVVAQAARSPGARRQKRYRDAHRDADETDGNVSLASHVDNGKRDSDVTSDTRKASQQTRRDETREIPLPPSESDETRARPPDPFASSFLPVRTDVAELHERWRRTTGLVAHVLKGPTDLDAVTLGEAIDAHGIERCFAVLSVAMRDPMVTGEADEKRQKHDSIRYIFGNSQTFARLEKLARERARKRNGDGALERAMTAEPDLSDYVDPEDRCPPQ